MILECKDSKILPVFACIKPSKAKPTKEQEVVTTNSKGAPHTFSTFSFRA